MADRIAILGGEPYCEWIERSGQAQRLFKAYRSKWPDGTAKCVAIGSDFYVRFRNGELRHVDTATDFDYESEWCAQCGTPIDSAGCDHYSRDNYSCDAVLCEYCGGSGNAYYCPRHRVNEMFATGKDDEYTYPYTFVGGSRFTFGVEIELESKLSDDFVENVIDSDIIAGWDKDASDSHNMVDAWIKSGYDNTVFNGQGLVALITPHGCLKWLEGEPVEYAYFQHVLARLMNFRACRKARPDMIDENNQEKRLINGTIRIF